MSDKHPTTEADQVAAATNPRQNTNPNAVQQPSTSQQAAANLTPQVQQSGVLDTEMSHKDTVRPSSPPPNATAQPAINPTNINTPSPTTLPGPQIHGGAQQTATTANQPSTQDVVTLIDDLRNNDLTVRVAAFKQLVVIGRALGTQRTRDELLPYLLEFIDDDDDVLIVLAERLGTPEMLAAVGGVQHANTLLTPLQQIVSTDESSVRDLAIKSIESLVQQMSEQQINDFVLPMLKLLSTGDWFTSRMSATALYAIVYTKHSNQQIRKELRSAYVKLCSDDTPMVRRAATTHLGKFAVATGDYTVVRSELFPSLAKLSKDEQDSVRLLTIDACIAISRLFKPADNITKMLPLVFNLCTDRSWRVRYMIADKFYDLCSALADEARSDDLIDNFVRLLQDDEPEVRTAATARVGEVAKLIGAQQTQKKLLGQIKTLVKDNSQFTRAALGSVLLSVGSVLKRKELIDHIVPLLLQLLKDSNAEVRLNIIAALAENNEVLSAESMRAAILPAIQELSSDPKWRIRLALIQHLPALAKQLGAEYFDQKLLQIVMNWLGDSVYSIREAATINLSELAQSFGKQWCETAITPKILMLAQHKSYLFRMTALQAMRDIAALLGTDQVQSKLLPAILGLLSDPVANVRFSAARVLGELAVAQLLPQSTFGNITSALQTLAKDSDTDCAYYANQSIAVLNHLQRGGTPQTAPKLETGHAPLHLINASEKGVGLISSY